MPPSHPSSEELTALALGQLASEALDAVADHVDTCLDCRNALQTLDGADDPMVELLKRPAGNDKFAAEPEFQQGFDKLIAIAAGRLGMPDHGDSPFLGCAQLTPSAHSGDTHPPQKPAAWAADVLPERFGRYRTLKCLGQGGMGAVYLAHDVELDRQVAVKAPKFDADASPELMERFYREARAAATLDHPNICPVYDVGQVDGVYYLVMAYIDGKPLADYVEPGQLLPQRQVAQMIHKLALALDEAHERGVVHRDLKPANIMVNHRRELVIMDFGLARLMKHALPGEERLTQGGVIMGTPTYMSPEQVLGDLNAMGPACDVYSLGVMMYELLTGRLPFRGVVAAVLAQVVCEEPAPPSKHRRDVEPELEAICLKAMAKSRYDRYASMAELAAALDAYLHGEAKPASVAAAADVVAPPAAPSGTETLSKNSSWNGLPRAPAPTCGLVEPSYRRRTLWRPWAVAAALVLGGLGFVAFYRVATDNGTLVVEIHDKEVEVGLKDAGLEVYDKSTGRTYSIKAEGEQRVRSGDYKLTDVAGRQLSISGDDGAVMTGANEFKLTRGGRVRVVVKAEPPTIAAQVLRPADAIPVHDIDADRRVAEWVMSIGGKLQIVGKEDRSITAIDGRLPETPFTIWSIVVEPPAQVDDDALVNLREITALQSLHLRHQPITDAGLAELAEMPGLAETPTLKFEGSRISDQGLAQFKRFRSLEHLGLPGSSISGAGLKHLADLPRLARLELSETHVADDGLVGLRGLRLTGLDLSQCPNLTDAAMEHVATLSHLEALHLGRTSIGDDGLRRLKELTDLKVLLIYGTRVTGAGLKALSSFKKLTDLHLDDLAVNDADLANLSDLAQLEVLSMYRTPVTDAGLKHLEPLKNLKTLFLNGAKVSAEVAGKLHDALPDCKIESDHGTLEPIKS